MEKAKLVKLAPTTMVLSIDDDFEAFAKNHLIKRHVKEGEMVDPPLQLLGHTIPLKVKVCEPNDSIIGEDTELHLFKFDTRSDMKLEETDLNIFMTDEQAKKNISDLILKTIITKDNGLALWREFKQNQSILT
jgi:hypothetical protein